MGGRHIPVPVVFALAAAAAAAMYAHKARAHDSADASLLQACVDPLLAPDEPSDNELAAERYGWPISTARPGMARRPIG